MKIRVLFIIFLTLSIVSTSGCWDYREINKLSIVMGVAVDRGEESNYKLTFEIVDLHEAGTETNIKSRLIESEGDTIFDGVRNVLTVFSLRPYFGHMRIVILSEQIAKEGVIDIIDFLNRDAEPRLNVDLLVSKGETANEVLRTESAVTEIRSFEIEQMLEAQEDQSKIPRVMVYQFVNDLPCKGIAPVLPALQVVEFEGKKTSALSGAAVFKGDKMVGYLNDEESNYFCYITDKVQRGLVVLQDSPEIGVVAITLEIYDSDTKVKTIYSAGKVSMDIAIIVRSALVEQSGNSKSENETEVLKIQKAAEEYIKAKTDMTIRSVQSKFGLDIFGFGKKVQSEMPQLWKEIEHDWTTIYKEMDVNVSISVDVENRGLLRHPIMVGEE